MNQPTESSLVTVSITSVMALSNAVCVRAPAARKPSLIFENASSIGEKSGEYGGRKNNVHLAASIKARTRSLL